LQDDEPSPGVAQPQLLRLDPPLSHFRAPTAYEAETEGSELTSLRLCQSFCEEQRRLGVSAPTLEGRIESAAISAAVQFMAAENCRALSPFEHLHLDPSPHAPPQRHGDEASTSPVQKECLMTLGFQLQFPCQKRLKMNDIPGMYNIKILML
jgi:hypothetical protein